jgi:hypothetical protein
MGPLALCCSHGQGGRVCLDQNLNGSSQCQEYEI